MQWLSRSAPRRRDPEQRSTPEKAPPESLVRPFAPRNCATAQTASPAIQRDPPLPKGPVALDVRSKRRCDRCVATTRQRLAGSPHCRSETTTGYAAERARLPAHNARRAWDRRAFEIRPALATPDLLRVKDDPVASRAW